MRRLHHRLRALAIAAAMACAPVVARADPITVFAVVEGFAGSMVAGAVATAVSFITTYGSYIAIAAGALDARRKARKAANAQRAAFNASLVDRNTVALTADPPLRAIYGRCIVGGDVVAVLTSDKTAYTARGQAYVKPDGWKHVVIVCASRQIEAIHDVLIEGVALGALDADGWPVNSDTTRTVREYREMTLAAGASWTAPANVQLLGLADNSAGDGLYEGAPRPSLPPAEPALPLTLSPDGKTATNPNAFAVALSLAYDVRVGSVRVSKFLGAPDQQADPWLRANVPDLWTENDRLRGHAGIVLTLDLEDTSHQSGIPKVEIDASGFLLHDPRDGQVRWSDNPALVIRDYLRSELGFGVSAADVDDGSFIAAANACDEAVLPSVQGRSNRRFTCNGTVTSDDDPEAVLDDLADCMAGQVLQGPAWRVAAGSWAPPVMDIGDDDLAGQAELVQGDTALDDLFNGARARFVPSDSGTVDDAVPYQNAAFVAADGEPLWTDVQLPFTNSRQRATNLLRIMVERTRAGLVLRVPCKLRAWPLQVGDRVRFTSAEYGLANAYMQVVDWQFGLGGAVVLTLQADAPEIYDLADAVSNTVAQTSSLPRPWVVAGIASLAATSGTSTLVRQADGTVMPRVRVSWAPVVDAYLAGGGFIRVRWRRWRNDPAGQWHEQDEAADATVSWLTGVVEGDALVILVQAFNRLGAAGKATSVYHEVVGKSAAASNVTGLQGSVAAGVITWRWSANTDLDSGHTEVRAVDGNWGVVAPAPLWRGEASSWQEPVAAAATVTRYVRHVDSSGNPSAATATAEVVVTTAQLAAAQGSVEVAAQAAAAATQAIERIASDGWLTRGEKSGVILEYTRIAAEIDGIQARAAAYGVTVENTAYGAAGNALTAYLDTLSPQWNDLSVDSPVDGAVIRAKFAAVYSARQAVLNAIAAAAGTVATWSGVSGIGKPASYATVGKSLGLPFESWALNGQSLVTLTDGKVGARALRLVGGGGSYPNQGNFTAIDRTKIYRARFWARPSPDAAGMLYFSLRQFQDDLGTAGSGNGGRSPYKPGGMTRVAHEAQFGGAYTWGEYSYIWSTADWQVGATFVQPEFLDNYSGASGHWDVQDFGFEEITEIRAAAEAATVAAAAAAAAQSAANTANDALANIASDSWLTMGEKPSVILDYTAITNELVGIQARASAYGLGSDAVSTAYGNAVYALSTHLSALSPGWSNLTVDTPIDGPTFRSKWADVYATRQALLNSIAAAAGTVATWAGVSGSGKPQDGATKNAVTYSTSAPSSPGEGDLWCDSSATPRVWRIRLSGAWQAAANYVTDTAQITDGAQLGLTALWAGVVGSGKPQDGATKNIVSYSGTEPSGPANGDVWVDTSGTPAVIKLRVGGAWQAGANLSTGSLAQLNAVDTAQIATGAITAVMSLSGGSVFWSNAF